MKRSFILLLSLLSCSAFAQQIKVRPEEGQIDRGELELTTCPVDTTAPAMVLCRDEQIHILMDPDEGFTRKEHVYQRIKILKEEGKEYASFKLYFDVSGNDAEYYSNIRLTTWYLNNGLVWKSTLQPNQIYEVRETDRIRSLSFAAENVTVGAVVELSYDFESPYVGDIGIRYLQQSIPVNQAELSVKRVDRIAYNVMRQGLFPVTYTCTQEKESSMAAGYRSSSVIIYTDQYKAVDIPAIHREEPYCFCTDLYRLGIRYDVNAVAMPGGSVENFAQEWSQVDAQLAREGYLKAFHGKSPFAEAARQAVQAAGSDEVAQIAAVRNAVAQQFRWNGKDAFWPSVKKALKAGEGDRADFNAITAAALESVGFTVDPVLVRTRDRGPVFDLHISENQFNSVILQVTTPAGNLYYLDAAPANTYVNLLPILARTEKARVLNAKKQGSWIDLSHLDRSDEDIVAALQIDADGTVRGEVSQTATGGSSFRMKGQWDQLGGDIAETLAGGEVTLREEKGFDTWSPQCSVRFGYEDSAEIVGDMMYVRPFVKAWHDMSAFTATRRAFPVEFPYDEQIRYRCTLTIPDGWAVEILPDPAAYAFPLLQAAVTFRAERTEDGHVQILLQSRRNGTFLEDKYYGIFRSWWEKVCHLYDTTIVLKKI